MYERQSTYRPHRNFGEEKKGGLGKDIARGVGKELKGLGKKARKEAGSWFGL